MLTISKTQGALGQRLYGVNNHARRTDVPLYNMTYGSMTELANECDKAWQEGRRCTLGTGWLGRSDIRSSWPAVMKAITQPWPEGMRNIAACQEEIRKVTHHLPQPVDRRRKKVWKDDDGDEVDMERLYRGQDFYQSTHRIHVRGPQYVSLVVNCVSAGSREACDIMWRGAAGIMIADLLENAGYRVEVWACDWCRDVFHDNDQSLVSVCLKRADDQLDTSNIVNGISGWFYRSILGFQALDIPTNPRQFSYGCVMDMDTSTPAIQHLAGKNGAMLVIDNVWSLKAAVAKVTEVINSVNDGSIRPVGD